MIQQPSKPIEYKYTPFLDIPDLVSTNIGDVKPGERLKVIINFVVMEKTKSFTTLRVNGVYRLTKGRAF